MKLVITIVLLVGLFQPVTSQVYYSRTGHVNVTSKNNIKTIEADNYQIISSIDFETGDVKFEGLLKSFEFKLGALDRVFNSKEINVNQHPKIKFIGKIRKRRQVKLEKGQTYDVEVVGHLYIWDEKRLTEAKAKLKVLPNGEVQGISNFSIQIEEASMHKLNALIDKKLPEVFNVSTKTFGVSRDIKIKLDVDYQLKNW